MAIHELLRRDLSRTIEEIIQLDQLDEQLVRTEITEYVATDSIKRHYRELLEAINEARTNPTERVGVWVSGFFGSGKSSFAKNLGYVLANRKLLGHSAADLFKAQVDDPAISSLIDVINNTIPTEVVMFDVQKDRAQTGQGGLSISPFVYRVLLRQLGYAEDFDLAELEISLEGEGKLDAFVQRYNAQYAAGKARAEWAAQGRKSAEAWNRAGVILHELDPYTYASPDSFAQRILQDRVQVTPKLLVERSFELMERRRQGKALALIIDEVGQYVAYSQERLEDLRAVVETFGMEGRNRARARQVPAPTWLIVTAQERLEEVTSAIGDERRVLLAKVQDRFPLRIDLSPSDVREVAARRVLAKTPDGERRLRELFRANEGQLNAACKLERTSRPTSVNEQAFVDFYPYLPHYIDLSIDVMSGIRLQPGAMRHVGGSNRTIISQVYQVLVNPRTDYANQPVGALVSLDRIYDLIEGQVGSAKQKDIADITE
ncbi:MAG: BREX system P-loop protein BrxC, partial [Chloroflexota bacterium]|nr:BREX system P-loop protein BrxC [Chloroflexota bacterium]